MSAQRVLLAAAGALIVTACGESRRAVEIAAAVESSVAIGVIHTGDPAIDQEANHFYAGREFKPAWITDRQVARARDVITFLDSAPQHGLPVHEDRFELEHEIMTLEAIGKPDPAQLADLDLRLTIAVLHFGRDAAIGVSSPARVNARWKARRALPDLAGTLAAANGDLTAWVSGVQPPHREYQRLREELVRTLTTADIAEDERQRRTEQLVLNMERWRWMPDDLGARHLFVNIPAYELHAREHGATVLEMRVVVGERRRNETPIFSGELQTAVFSPAWNVPARIAREETVPAATKDESYLSRQKLDVFRRTRQGLAPVDPSAIDWSDADAVHGLTFRQRPGPGNALGHVKFLFPNPYDVYLHDTPNDSVFARQSRALSHGCIRVSEPAQLAQYVLRDQAPWDESSIKTAMHAGREQHVKLAQAIPVHIAYFTAWPLDDGTIAFFDDVYGYDARQARPREDEN